MLMDGRLLLDLCGTYRGVCQMPVGLLEDGGDRSSAEIDEITTETLPT